MRIVILKSGQNIRLDFPNVYADSDFPIVYLIEDMWNDYSYRTLCTMYVMMHRDAERELIGKVRVMFREQRPNVWTFDGRKQMYEKLSSSFCSLGQDIDYYRSLHALENQLGKTILRALKDAAYYETVWKSFEGYECFRFSLIRETGGANRTRAEVRKLFGSRKLAYRRFVFKFIPIGADDLSEITFDFSKKKELPRRIILLVGPNGAGKTQLLSQLAIVLSGLTAEVDAQSAQDRETAVKKRRAAGFVRPIPTITAVVAISFNAFDKFEIPKAVDSRLFRYTYCGIRKDDASFRTEADLEDKIRTVIGSMSSEKLETLRHALESVFGNGSLFDLNHDAPDIRYEKLSAGQRILLNMLTHLVDTLDTNTLVLLDEPETHLHPSLTTALLSVLGELLEKYNSFAIIATHSSLIAQQVPSRSIRVLRRTDNGLSVSSPDIECFGENLSDIANALFDVPEFSKDYTAVLESLLKRYEGDAEKIEALFGGRLGSNAKLYLWGRKQQKGKL